MTQGRITYLCLQATRQGQASYAHVHEISDGLEHLGFDVTLFEPGYADDSRPRPGVLGRLAEFVRVQTRFITRLKDSDVAYVRDHPAALPAMVAARLRGVPVVLEVNAPWHELLASYPRLRPLRGPIGLAFRMRAATASAMIAVTMPLADWLRSEYRHPLVEVVPNAANVRLFSPAAPRMEGLPARYVAFFGALAPWQGIDTILAAVSSDSWPTDVAVVVAGEGSEAARVQEAASRESRIRYIGRVPYEQVPGLIAGSIAGLCPKTNTGADWSSIGLSPLKAYEILACGVPAIVSDFPGLADLVRDNQAGEVIPPADPEALARAVRRLAEDPARQAAAGARGRVCIAEQHSWDARSSATASIIRTVMGS